MKSKGHIPEVLDGLFRTLFSTVYPDCCYLCGERLPRGQKCLCPSCLRGLPRATSGPGTDNGIDRRLAGVFPYVKGMTIFNYAPDNSIPLLVKEFKYGNHPEVAEYLGKVIFQELCFTNFFSGIDCIVPMPIHWTRLMHRGYNQVYHLARGLSGESGLPIAQLLKAHRHTSQTHQTLLTRRLNARGKYYAEFKKEYAGRHLLLLDDVCTTGSTLTAAAEALLAAYPGARLSLLTLCATIST